MCATCNHSVEMGLLTHEQKTKIVRLRARNKNISEIVRILAEDDCKTSRLSVRLFLRRFKERDPLKISLYLADLLNM